MLKFNGKTMKKAVVAEEFAVEDENFCISRAGGYDSVMAKPGMELWIISEAECENYGSTEMSLCWIPKFGFATTLASKFVDYIPTESKEEREALDMIDTASKQVESLAKGDVVDWKNGDSLLWKNGNGEFLECNTGRYIGYDSVENKHIFVRTDVDTYYIMYAKRSAISKPESQEQKAERGLLEAAYDLYIAGQESLGVNEYQSFQQFTSDKVQVRFWLGVAGTAGYRKVKQ